MDFAAPASADAAKASVEAKMKNPSNTSLEVRTIHANLLQRGASASQSVRAAPRIGQEGLQGGSTEVASCPDRTRTVTRPEAPESWRRTGRSGISRTQAALCSRPAPPAVGPGLDDVGAPFSDKPLSRASYT
ncbi:hypothetical protein GCM10012319_08650 [Comamonas sp. KCTC 72670]|nr:hypothetical protein GCM10012319_08650 [Comamonas sp. KCTC 72670]